VLSSKSADKYEFPNFSVDSKGNAKRLQPDRLQWNTTVGIPKERRYVRVSGVASDIEIVPFNNDIRTLQRAVAERVFFVKENGNFTRPPRPEKGVFKGRMTTVFDLLRKELPSTAPISHQQFVDSYKGRKQAFYQQALNDLRFGYTNLERDAHLNVFVKFEKN
jgi:hypothetical protein